MANLAAPTIDWSGGDEPQAQGKVVTVDHDLLPYATLVLTVNPIAAPAPHSQVPEGGGGGGYPIMG